MKTLIHLFALSGLLALAPLGAAEPAPTSPAPTLPAAKEMAALEHFLDLTDQDLEQMQRVIARIRAMSPDERAVLRREIEKFRTLPGSQRHQMRLGWGALDADLQDAWRRMMQAATPERRAEIQARLQSLPPEKKGSFRRQLAEEFIQLERKK
jgi:hypothetical protein